MFKHAHTNRWAAIQANQKFLFAVAEVAGGQVPHQCSLHLSFRKWLADQHLTWSLGDTERAIIDLRHMLKRLQRANTLEQKPPKKFAGLSKLVDLFDGGQEARVTEAEVDDDDDDVRSEEPVVVCEAVQTIATAIDVSDVCSSPSSPGVELVCTAENYDDMMPLDDLENALFTKKKRLRCRQKTSSIMPATIPGSVGIAEMEDLFEVALESEGRAPTPSCYRARFKKSKKKKKKKGKGKARAKGKAKAKAKANAGTPEKARPARGADEEVETPPKVSKSSAPAFSIDAVVKGYLHMVDDATTRKRVHSNVWHRQQAFGISQGLPKPQVAQLAGEKGRAAVKRFIELKTASSAF